MALASFTFNAVDRWYLSRSLNSGKSKHIFNHCLKD